MDVKPDFRPGTYCNAAAPKWMEWIDYPYPAAWSVPDDDWATARELEGNRSCRGWKTG